MTKTIAGSNAEARRVIPLSIDAFRYIEQTARTRDKNDHFKL